MLYRDLEEVDRFENLGNFLFKDKRGRGMGTVDDDIRIKTFKMIICVEYFHLRMS